MRTTTDIIDATIAETILDHIRLCPTKRQKKRK